MMEMARVWGARPRPDQAQAAREILRRASWTRTAPGGRRRPRAVHVHRRTRSPTRAWALPVPLPRPGSRAPLSLDDLILPLPPVRPEPTPSPRPSIKPTTTPRPMASVLVPAQPLGYPDRARPRLPARLEGPPRALARATAGRIQKKRKEGAKHGPRHMAALDACASERAPGVLAS